MRACLIALVALAGCSSVDERRAAASDQSRVIAVLALENERLTIRSSAAGPRFDVTSTDGRLLSRDLDLDGLALRHSELYDVYRTSHARADDEPFLDARLD